MPRALFVDFKAVKAAVSMEQILQHYDLLDQFKKSGDSLSGPCPIHKGENPTQFRVSVAKNVWHCFSKCQRGGNALDFISLMEDVSIHAAAVKAIEWFNLDMDAVSGDREQQHEPPPSKTIDEHERPASKEEPQTEEEIAPNKPLKFRLDKLQREHPYLIERGLTLETLIDFGAGYCSKGMMAGRVAIPIHTVDGEVVAYAGRFPGEPPEGTPKYKLPQGFRKSLELFNIDRAKKESPDQPLVIVEGFFGCMALHQHGHRKVGALMGSSMSAAQEEIIRRHTNPDGRVIVMLDEDEAGQAGRDDIAVRLSKFCFVRVHQFERPDMQPEHLTADELPFIVGGAA
ncbi:MAG TPA: CHC2 zinc finger domain-containing protein [Candidatus Acidoferrum sp.]|nr:CHC2 zinc finger domain-containing protein [Candidatus Acidoferrum sp.]